MDIVVPIKAILAIYANENGRGMVFSEEENGDMEDDFYEEEESGTTTAAGSSDKRKPFLHIVK